MSRLRQPDCGGKCSEHLDTDVIWEPGGDDMPTTNGRWYCPECQEIFMEILSRPATITFDGFVDES